MRSFDDVIGSAEDTGAINNEIANTVIKQKNELFDEGKILNDIIECEVDNDLEDFVTDEIFDSVIEMFEHDGDGLCFMTVVKKQTFIYTKNGVINGQSKYKHFQ